MNLSGRPDDTPDAHLFPTHPYDLVKEFVVALVVVGLLTVLLAAVLSSPDKKAISLSMWAKAAPADVVATATAELGGTSGTAGYGPPYNHASPGQTLGPLALQRWAGVSIPINSARDFVIGPLESIMGDQGLTAALKQWHKASLSKQRSWAGRYGSALAKAPQGSPAKVAKGDYGPVPVLTKRFLTLAKGGSLGGSPDHQQHLLQQR